MPIISRRTLLKGSAAAAASFAIGGGLAARNGIAAPAPLLLKAQFTEATLASDGITPKIMTYGTSEAAATGMPPVIRMKKGEPFAARLMNALDEPTTIHWHGLRIVNAMDGVPEMTQPYVYPGDGFDYAFTPPDAGTFWYHPHCNTLTQMGHGLTGVIVVEDPARSGLRCRDRAQPARLAARYRRRLHRAVQAARCRARRHLRHGAHRQLAAGSRAMTRRPAAWCASGSPPPT